MLLQERLRLAAIGEYAPGDIGQGWRQRVELALELAGPVGMRHSRPENGGVHQAMLGMAPQVFRTRKMHRIATSLQRQSYSSLVARGFGDLRKDTGKALGPAVRYFNNPNARSVASGPVIWCAIIGIRSIMQFIRGVHRSGDLRAFRCHSQASKSALQNAGTEVFGCQNHH